jgi:glycosyltransferase A (GT-A) superfamily protein (DUF2064 family)
MVNVFPMETQFDFLPVQVIVFAERFAALHGAPLREALGAVHATPVARRILGLERAGDEWLPNGFDLIGQRGGGYGERMAAMFADAHATAALPMLLIRPDATGITPDMLADAARSLTSPEADAVFGPASDGGFWLLGLRRPDRSLVVGIPGPADGGAPGRLLLDRLASAGFRVALAPRLEVAGAPAPALRG